MTKKINQFKTSDNNSKAKDAENPDNPATSKGPSLGFLKNEKFLKIVGVFLLFLSGYLLFAFSSFLFTWDTDQDKMLGSLFELIFRNDLEVDNWAGKFGAIISHQLIHKWFGIASFLFIFLAFISSIRILFNIVFVPLSKAFRYSFFGIIFISVFFGFIFRDSFFYLGGFFGYQLNQWLIGVLGNIGTGLLLAFTLLSFLIITFNISFNWFKAQKEDVEEVVSEPEMKNELKNEEPENIDTPTEIEFESELELEDEERQAEELSMPLTLTPEPVPVVEQEINIESANNDVQFLVETPVEKVETIAETPTTEEMPFGEYDPTLDLSSYKYPTTDLLENYGSGTVKVNKEELEANKDKILETLRNYSIDISKIKATIGPTVTLYEIIPAPGVRISKIKNLEDDIALSLSALGIRIIAPIPGKGTIGIEVPNLEPEMVSMRSVLASEKFQNSSMDLPVALGKTISNEIFIADLAKMPHLLMAGATGQGKSVGLNAILVSLLYKKHPSQIKFVLVDPKKVELTLFAKIERHFLAKLPDSGEAIITDTTKVVHTLKSLCIEMDLRYDLLKEAQVRNLKEYNAKFIARKLNPNKGHRFLPYIVLVVDEFADLIMTAGKEVEMPIARLAQLARAIGIHLIIATQRPSVNIITGTIKANFPTRIAFRVTSKIDSRTILDTGGAEQLIGRGDMLFSPGNEVIRLQCAFVDTPEVEKITEFIGSQRGYPEAHHLPEYVDENAGDAKDFDLSEKDSFFNEAAKIIVMHQQGSASLLQRKLKLGYNRAGRIIDQLEAAGVIGPFEGSKARQVLIADEHSLEQFLNNLNTKN